jgi:transposase
MEMRDIEERERVLNMYFKDGKGYKCIASELNISLNTIKSWCRRYRISYDIPKRGETPLAKDTVAREMAHTRKPKDETSPEARIARLEMEVELLRNFLILTEER